MKNTFRLVGVLEGLSYILLLFIAVPIKYLAGDESYVKLLGMPHGILFLMYLLFAYYVRDQFRWKAKTFYFVLLASIIPFGTFYIDRKFLRN